MSSRPFSRKVVVLVLFAILALPWVSAAGQEDVRPAANLFEQVWSFLTSLWSESGCRIDPNGGCAPEPMPMDDTDSGCHIDPNGGCRS
ncbi:MAG TPA: hypothetical protein VNW71_01470 [Thermoanaerobaculia bacterium]|nr:hypothetical protein [Thermoanaerobaculia bacterium]